ncbi:MAG: hypothetical protein A3C35_01245 [Omnitrophica bacterium RIFCSPHIGHO2_02_FULL_46_11]|nr:MAG: hypothetical protein A3C35_01245 [Omnitrophica bacterium RIFCSPHIGHO2_02_FULL_46_11]OGW87084.1 MAG: hypothetical protein A3A81_00640 [Omnitrophica bacterium RIFCSPLOWO2_01_FULL_45_10b]
MTLVEIAQIYTDLVRLDDQTPTEEYQTKDRINALRTKYHQMLMDKMREESIYFSDRFDATQKAFEIIHKEKAHS